MEDARVLIAQSTKEVAAQVLSLLPKDLSRKVRKAKSAVGPNIHTPTSIYDVNTEELAQFTTNDNESILFHDSGVVEDTRVVIFATPADLDLLKECTVIAFDGTCEVLFIG